MAESSISSPRRRWRSWFVGAVLLASGAVGAYEAASWAAPRFEQRTVLRVTAALEDAGTGWAEVAADGLTLRLSGTAPDTVQRVRAVATATAAAGIARIDDRITVPRPAETAPPPFRLEVLRNEHGTSVIGLTPAATDRPAMMAQLDRLAGSGRLTDLVEEADHPAPEGWDAALAFGLQAAQQMPRAKISVTPGRVEVVAVTDGEAEKARLEQALAAAVPEGVTLATDISAPRPVIAPFALQLVRTAEGTRLERCAAGSEPDRDRILSAAREAGAEAECAVGLGAPSPQWADAAAAGIAALDTLPAGRLTISDLRVTLAAPHEVPPTAFETARAGLETTLPPGFTLSATLDPAPVAADDSPISFVASANGQGVQLRGAVADRRMGAALESLAGARFGPVDSGLSPREDTPPGWTARVMAAVDAMNGLDRGSATVTPELIRLSGTTGSPTAAQEIADRLAARLDPGTPYELALTYDPRLDPAVDLPSGEDCVDALNSTMQQSEIGFEPNRDVIAGDAAPVMRDLGATLQRCADFRIEVGGHTDSQGSDSFNRELSAARAQAVLTALAEAGFPTANLAATGYGETRPLGPNDTEAGREANRRIEFRLLSPDPLNQTPPSAIITRGVTGGPAPASQTPPAPLPPAEAAEPEGPVSPEGPTPDELAGYEGIAIRPQEVTIEGRRLTTPVPPPLAEGPVLAPDTDEIRRPRARPEE